MTSRDVRQLGEARRVGSTTIAPVGVWCVETTATVRSGSAVKRLAGDGGAEQVEAEVGVDAAGDGAVGALVVVFEDADVGDHRAALLGEAGLVEAAHLLAVDQRRHADDLGHRHDAGAADADHADHALAGNDLGIRNGTGAVGRPRGRALPGMTSRNDGQSPSRQERSELQDAWWICVLRPNSVSTGSTERHLDFAPQSPQPSQTRSLMATRVFGRGELAALDAPGASPSRTSGRG